MPLSACNVLLWRVIFYGNDNTIGMNKTVKTDKHFWLTIALALLIVVLACTAFLPTVLSKRTTTQAISARAVDSEAMRVLGCCNAYVAANGFKTTMSGAIRASVVGVPYTQKIRGSRTVDSNSYIEVAESVSALVKAAIKRERRDGAYYVSHGTYKNKAFKYDDEQKLSRSSYVAQYGQPFTGVVKYNIENTITQATRVSDNTYTYTLDPNRATVYSRNEVKTTLGGKTYPHYKSVEFTLVTDGDRPVKVTSTEKFRIDKFGGTDCTAEYTEVFNFN